MARVPNNARTKKSSAAVPPIILCMAVLRCWSSSGTILELGLKDRGADFKHFEHGCRLITAGVQLQAIGVIGSI